MLKASLKPTKLNSLIKGFFFTVSPDDEPETDPGLTPEEEQSINSFFRHWSTTRDSDWRRLAHKERELNRQEREIRRQEMELLKQKYEFEKKEKEMLTDLLKTQQQLLDEMNNKKTEHRQVIQDVDGTEYILISEGPLENALKAAISQ